MLKTYALMMMYDYAFSLSTYRLSVAIVKCVAVSFLVSLSSYSGNDFHKYHYNLLMHLFVML